MKQQATDTTMAAPNPPLVVLFGYDSSAFTLKMRTVLRLKQIPYTFLTVPSMMPRPLLHDIFHLTYRKIPVLAIGRELYCDTALMTEALEHHFPAARSLYPATDDGDNYRAVIRGFASYWTDRPLYRVMTGLIPAQVWRTSFGEDRARFIGHKLDATKLERKIPENLTRLDMHLSMLEPLFTAPCPRARRSSSRPWIFSSAAPSLADVSLYIWLDWGSEIAKGHLIENLSGGGTKDTDSAGATAVWNSQRYPGVWGWFERMKKYMDELADVETKDPPLEEVLSQMRASPDLGRGSLLLPTPRPSLAELCAKVGLLEGALVSVTPDDAGRDE